MMKANEKRDGWDIARPLNFQLSEDMLPKSSKLAVPLRAKLSDPSSHPNPAILLAPLPGSQVRFLEQKQQITKGIDYYTR
jgi:hypothetical protein